ncbi:hypothetical protein F4680DRAFT_454866 [Xylaria scruposa]|nr:hypothetical protein F4680DRAFT_454866 [Xylaria scruposa]
MRLTFSPRICCYATIFANLLCHEPDWRQRVKILEEVMIISNQANCGLKDPQSFFCENIKPFDRETIEAERKKCEALELLIPNPLLLYVNSDSFGRLDQRRGGINYTSFILQQAFT